MPRIVACCRAVGSDHARVAGCRARRNGHGRALHLHFVEILSQAREAMSYRDARTHRERYRSLPRFSESPGIEGVDANPPARPQDNCPIDAVLIRPPRRTERGRSRPAAARRAARLDSASTHRRRARGLTGGGLRARRGATATTARVTPMAFDGQRAPATSALAPGTRCRLVRRAVGQTRVAIAAGSVSPLVAAALQDLDARSEGLAAKSPSLEQARWIVVEDPRSGAVFLEHRSLTADSDAPEAPPRPAGDVSAGGRRILIASSANSPDLPARLARAATAIARADALRTLAGPTTTGARGAAVLQVTPTPMAAPAPRRSSARTAQRRTCLSWATGRVPRSQPRDDASRPRVFFVDGGYASPPSTRPWRGVGHAPRRRERDVIGAMMDTRPFGQEDLVVIGLRPSKPAVNLAVLAQSTLAGADTLSRARIARPGRLSELLRRRSRARGGRLTARGVGRRLRGSLFVRTFQREEIRTS